MKRSTAEVIIFVIVLIGLYALGKFLKIDSTITGFCGAIVFLWIAKKLDDPGSFLSRWLTRKIK